MATALQRARAGSQLEVRGTLTRLAGLVLEATGISVPVGSQCRIFVDGQAPVLSEVVGFSNDRAFLMPAGDVHGLRPGASVVPAAPYIPVPRLGDGPERNATPTAGVLRTEPVADKWAACGWHVQRVDGNDVDALLKAFDGVESEPVGIPSVILCDTRVGRGVPLLDTGRLRKATRIAHAIAEITNVPPYSRQPYVGASAFAHKAGLHASAIRVDPDLYQHTDPQYVGNDMRMLVSDMAGRASIELKGRELGYDLSGDDETLSRVLGKVKDLELGGYTFDAADASFELLLRREVEGTALEFFEVQSWRVITDARGNEEALSEATVKLVAGGERVVATGEGNGPVNALDHALRTALAPAYPELDKLELIDFRVRILDAAHGTDAVTRVLIETSDGTTSWETVGVAPNIVEASWLALVDGITYGLLRQKVPVR